MKNTLLLLVLAIILFSCKKKEPKIESKTVTKTESKIAETFKDTVVLIKAINSIENKDSISMDTKNKKQYEFRFNKSK